MDIPKCQTFKMTSVGPREGFDYSKVLFTVLSGSFHDSVVSQSDTLNFMSVHIYARLPVHFAFSTPLLSACPINNSINMSVFLIT